jgi:hypothetical protein
MVNEEFEKIKGAVMIVWVLARSFRPRRSVRPQPWQSWGDSRVDQSVRIPSCALYPTCSGMQLKGLPFASLPSSHQVSDGTPAV